MSEHYLAASNDNRSSNASKRFVSKLLRAIEFVHEASDATAMAGDRHGTQRPPLILALVAAEIDRRRGAPPAHACHFAEWS